MSGSPTGGMVSRERILGINFFPGATSEAVSEIESKGGCALIPASPALVKLNYDSDYRRALQTADLVIPDSTLLCLVWRVASGRKLEGISGTSYLRALLAHPEFRSGQQNFWIVRSESARDKTYSYLLAQGLSSDSQTIVLANHEEPSSNNHDLLLQIEQRKPASVIIAGRGNELLGIYLRDYLLYRPSIHCVGAALGFLTGEEQPIPLWAERYHLAWLIRLRAHPLMLFPRLGIALIIALMIFRFRSEMPPLKKRWTEL